MADWQAALIVLGNLLGLMIVAGVIVHDLFSGRVRSARREKASKRRRGGSLPPSRGRRRRRGLRKTAPEEEVWLPDYLQTLSKGRGRVGKKKRRSRLTDKQLAGIITEQTRPHR